MFTRYNKFWYTLLAAVVVFLGALHLALNEDNLITTQEWIMALSTFLGPFVTLLAPANEPEEF
jgi:hypothetical protein